MDPGKFNPPSIGTYGLGHQGVDYRSVERNSWRWDAVELPELLGPSGVLSSEQVAH